MNKPEITAATTAPSKPKRSQLDDRIGEICIEWWAGLNAVDLKTGMELPREWPDRAAIAALRRIGTIQGPAGDEIDTAFAVAISGWKGAPYVNLRKRLSGLLSKWHDDYVQRIPARPDFDAAVAVVGATLARVRMNRKGSVAKLLGSGDDRKLMAEARFKRLIRTSTAPDLLDQGRRIVMLLGREAPIGDLGASLLLWSADPYAKRRWSFDYFDASDMNSEPASDADDAAPEAASQANI